MIEINIKISSKEELSNLLEVLNTKASQIEKEASEDYGIPKELYKVGAKVIYFNGFKLQESTIEEINEEGVALCESEKTFTFLHPKYYNSMGLNTGWRLKEDKNATLPKMQE